MNVSGKLTIFAKVLKNKEGKESIFFNTNLSRKDGDEKSTTYSHYACDVKFVGSEITTEKLIARFKENVAYQIDVTEGFLSFRDYDDKEGNHCKRLVIIVQNFKPITKKEVKTAKTDLPF